MCVWAGAVLKGNLQFGWQMPEKSTGACVRLIGPKFKSWEMGGVLSGNWNAVTGRCTWREDSGGVCLTSGSAGWTCWKKDGKSHSEFRCCIECGLVFSSVCPLSLGALFTNGSFQRLLERLLPIQGYLQVKFVLVCGLVPGSRKGGLDCVNSWPLVYCSKCPK